MIQNAIIKSAEIEIEDHGFLTLWLHLDYGGAGQGFGGYALEGEYLALHVRGLLTVFEVTRWRDLAGKSCRADGNNSGIERIGHFLKDQWFVPRSAEIQGMDKS